MSTYFPKGSEVSRRWFVVDAQDQALGRLASHVANLLAGKLKPTWVPFMDMGDHVIIVNAEKVKLTGKKLEQKMYYRYSGYPGGMRSVSAQDLKAKRPDRMVEIAIKGMLPKNKLGRAMASKLKVYAGATHPHAAQQPEVSVIN
ncbi:MAG TPA: 50S ribosomal protein L13 [Terriglobia bacterium]|nr:50S ribosomal protein L13 [Terriglobia bacterium]